MTDHNNETSLNDDTRIHFVITKEKHKQLKTHAITHEISIKEILIRQIKRVLADPNFKLPPHEQIAIEKQNQKPINFYLSEELHTEFKLYSIINKLPMKFILTYLIDDFLENK